MILLSFDTEEFDVPREHGVDFTLEQGMEVSIAGTIRILDMLKQNDVRATFFCTGNFATHAPEVMKRIIDEDLSVRQVEMLTREKPARKQKDVLPESYKIQAETLAKALKMGVKVSRDSKGKGSLTITFKNDDEFERLLDFINKGN